MDRSPLQFGVFSAPFRPAGEAPAEPIQRELALPRRLGARGRAAAWVRQRHGPGCQIVAAFERSIGHAPAMTRCLRPGSGVASRSDHHPLMVADRIPQLDHQTREQAHAGSESGSRRLGHAMVWMPGAAAAGGAWPAD